MAGGILLNEIVIIAGLPLLIVYVLGFDKSKLFPFYTPKFWSWVGAAFLAVLVALLIDYTAAASDLVFPIPERYREMIDRLMAFDGTGSFIIKLFLLAIVPGICEELFFRGFCQNSFEARWGTTISIIITTVLFAILHGNPWYFHLYLMLGFFLSWIYAICRTLWIPITCHIVNNAWTFINHSQGVEYPIRSFSNPLDITIILTCLLLIIAVSLKLRSYHV